MSSEVVSGGCRCTRTGVGTGGYGDRRVKGYLLPGTGIWLLAVPGCPWLALDVPGRCGPHAGLAPFQSQDRTLGFPSFRSARVEIHERGGSA